MLHIFNAMFKMAPPVETLQKIPIQYSLIFVLHHEHQIEKFPGREPFFQRTFESSKRTNAERPLSKEDRAGWKGCDQDPFG